MQGRLSPPRPDNPQYFPGDRWRVEYEEAARLGFDTVEWLLDTRSLSTNPILTGDGQRDIVAAGRESGVRTATVCADHFKGGGLISGEPGHDLRLLERLVEATVEIGAACMLLPFIEQSSVEDVGGRLRLTGLLRPALELAASGGLALAVETDLAADVLSGWVDEVAHPAFGVYYDLGNAVADGFDPVAEIAILGDRIRGVHVKDRSPGGPNVPLGEGEVDFVGAFAALTETGYDGPLVLETVRGDDFLGDARKHLNLVNRALTVSASSLTNPSIERGGEAK